MMEPAIVDMDEMAIVGFAEEGADIRALWVRFSAQEGAIADAVEGAHYELHFHPDGEHEWQDVTVMVGVQVTAARGVPEGMSVEVLPASRYAVFTHRLADGGYEGANQAMDAWLRDGPYLMPRQLSIQRYGERFKGGTAPDSEIDFLLPVQPKQPA